MSASSQLALLRGLNVGGKNLVKMAELRAAFTDLGAGRVATYIASGNVLFAGLGGRGALARLETGLSDRFELELKAVLLAPSELAAVVDGAPDGFGADTDRCDVVFVRPPLTPQQVFERLDPRDGIDRAWCRNGVVYHSRLAERASGSRFGRISAYPEYKELTIRSWNTTTTLRTRLDAHAAGED